jgi:hypothetical protein
MYERFTDRARKCPAEVEEPAVIDAQVIERVAREMAEG